MTIPSGDRFIIHRTRTLSTYFDAIGSVKETKRKLEENNTVHHHNEIDINDKNQKAFGKPVRME